MITLGDTVLGLIVFFLALLAYAIIGRLDDEYWNPPEDLD